MNWLRFSIAVVLTSAALVVAVFATGAFVVGNALASGGAQAFAERGVGFGLGRGPGFNPGQGLPPELASLKDVPAADRFAHFKGIQANLTDKDGKPITIQATPGVATAVSATSLTIQGNDGASHTYALSDQTMTRGNPVSSGENVVVITLDNTRDARAVFGANPGDWGHR